MSSLNNDNGLTGSNLKEKDQKDHTADVSLTNLSLSSRAIHADDFLNDGQDVAPAMHVSTTYRYNNDPDKLTPYTDPTVPVDGHIYSRETAPNTTRLEAILTDLMGGPALTYASGLSSFHALIVFLNPKRISIGSGYHGCHSVIDVHRKLTGLQKLPLDCPAEELQAGDIIHVETPMNPTGEARDLAHYAKKARSRGAYLTVDATFAPPPLMNPFSYGVDIVMHSGTKYVGGHSDMLCGILVINPSRKADWFEDMKGERTHLGNVMGSMEGWLGIRSVRTMEIRVERQCRNTEKLVSWLNTAVHSPPEEKDMKHVGSGTSENELVRQVVANVKHASLQIDALQDGWLRKQMPNGFGPVFAINMRSRELARRLPSKLRLFHHATSLGGVESLIEWRTMSDSEVADTLLRVSVGIEGWEDLKDDFVQGFRALAAESRVK